MVNFRLLVLQGIEAGRALVALLLQQFSVDTLAEMLTAGLREEQPKTIANLHTRLAAINHYTFSKFVAGRFA